MRLPTAAWFAAGCGLAVVSVVAVQGATGMMRDAAHEQREQWAEQASSLQALTPAPEAPSAPTVVAPVPASEVPVQRPAHLRGLSPVSPSVEWTPDDARLPRTEATRHWDPDDARIPDGPIAVMAARAYWNPNSAALPRPNNQPPAAWDPNDARLPTL